MAPGALKRVPPALAALLAAAPTVTRAQQGDAYELGPIVARARAAIARTEVVSDSDIARRGARTLDEAMALLPGVTVHTGGDGVPRIDVRGLRPRQVRVLVNGVPLNSTYDGQFDPTMIPTDDIAAVTLTTAGASVLYGGGSDLGATINIQTRRGTGPVRVTQAGVEDGAGGARRAWGSAGGAFGDGRADAYLSASGLRRADYPLPDGRRDNSFRDRETLYAHAAVRPSDAWRLGAVLNHVQGAQGIPPSVSADPADPFAAPPRYERLPHQRSDAVQLAAAFTPRAAWALRGWAFGTNAVEDDDRYDDGTYSSMSDSTVRGTFALHSTLDVAGMHLEPRHDFGPAVGVSLALDWERDTWRQSGVIRDAGGGGGGGGGGGNATFGLRNVQERRVLTSGGLAAEYRAAPWRGLELSLGWRQQWQTPDGDGRTLGGRIAMAAARYAAGAWRVRAAVARHVRFPSIRQLYDASAGDSTLGAERATEVEAGLARTGAVASVEVTLFQHDVHDFIEMDEATRRFANFPHYRFRGVELGAAADAWAPMRLRLGYTYLVARNRSPGGATALQYRPRHRTTLEATLRPGAGFSVDATAQYVSRQAYLSRRPPTLTGELPDYTLLDGRIARAFGRPGVSLYLGARNLLGRAYETSYGFPEPGREWYGGLRLWP